MTQIQYRKANVGDIVGIQSVTINAYWSYQDVISKENLTLWQENLMNEQTYRELFNIATCFVAIYSGKIVGSAFVFPRGNPNQWFSAEWSYMRLLAVIPEFWGNGIGRKLTEFCVIHAKQSGEKVIALHTSEFQQSARHIYESMGFKKQSQFELFKKKYWVYTMSFPNPNQNEFRIYRAGVEDVKTLVEYRIRFALELGGDQTKEKIEELQDQMLLYFEKATTDQSCISVIAKRNNEVAGIGSIHFRETPGNFKNPSGKWGYIMNMYTLPAFRRNGIGTRIINMLIEEGKNMGVTAFELHATQAGEPVYLKNGFELHREPTLRKFIENSQG